MKPLTEKWSMNSNKVWIFLKLDSSKNLQPMKLEWKPQILVKLRLRELCDSELPWLHTFYNIAISRR